MQTTINGVKFQITKCGSSYIVAKWDWEEYRVPHYRATYWTLKGALRRCKELSI